MSPRRSFVTMMIAAIVAFAPAFAHADEWTWLDYARRVPRAFSASRDTPRLEVAPFPRAVVTAGGELALARWQRRDFGFRAGFAGFIEQDGERETEETNSGPWPAQGGAILWRGSYAFFLAYDAAALGERICSTCALELTLTYRHESEHYTGGNYGDAGRDFSNQPYVGDDFILDVAVEEHLGDFYLQQRVVGMWFLPDRSSYSGGVAVDVHARWTGWSWAHPFASGYAEYLVGDDIVDRVFPDAYRARLLLGVALPSRLGDLMIFGFGDVGHRYGLQALTEEATLGFGVRLALGRSWPPRGQGAERPREARDGGAR